MQMNGDMLDTNVIIKYLSGDVFEPNPFLHMPDAQLDGRC